MVFSKSTDRYFPDDLQYQPLEKKSLAKILAIQHFVFQQLRARELSLTDLAMRPPE
jgi:hypothetical protein